MAELSTSVQKALAALDIPEMLKCLQALLALPSVTGSAAESEAQHWFARKLEESNLETDLWQIDLAETLAHKNFPGMEVARQEAYGLVGRWGNNDGPTLALNGHMDVVPVGDEAQWTVSSPFSGHLQDGKIYGRGACDMKAGLVCNLYALKAIQAAGLRLRGNVLLQSVVGEEDGGLGTFATLLRGYRGDAAIITEPTELALIPACAGALTFRLRVAGLSAHASSRLEGISAIEKFWSVWNGLRELESERNRDKHVLMSRYELPYALSIGILQAGNWPSSVPDALFAEGRLGVKLGEAPEEARRQLEEAVAAVCQHDPWLRQHPVEVEWFGGQFASGQISQEHPLVQLVGNAQQRLQGAFPAVHGAPYGSDLRLMVGLGGVPALHYGPGSVKQAHAPNEFVPIAEMETVVRTLVLAILEFCGYE